MRRDKKLEALGEEAENYVLGKMDRFTEERFQQRLKAGCGLCAAEVKECEVLFEQALKPLEVTAPEGLRAKILGKLPKQQAVAGEAVPGFQWRETGIDGVSELLIHQTLGGACARLVRLLPGSMYPEHTHDSAEHCYVLEGELNHEGHTVRAGAFLSATVGSRHTAIVSDVGCLLLLVNF